MGTTMAEAASSDIGIVSPPDVVVAFTFEQRLHLFFYGC